MAGASIREYVRLNLPESYLVITRDAAAPYDGKEGRPDIVGLSIKVTIEEVLPVGKTEADVTTEFGKAFIADVASRRIIISLINYHMERTGLSDSISPPGRGNPLQTNETRQHYNRVQVLKDLDAMLAGRIAGNLAQFQSLVSTTLTPKLRGAMVSSYGQRLRTQNPLDFPSVWGLPTWLPLPFGVGYSTWGDIGLPVWGANGDESVIGDPAEPFSQIVGGS